MGKRKRRRRAAWDAAAREALAKRGGIREIYEPGRTLSWSPHGTLDIMGCKFRIKGVDL